VSTAESAGGLLTLVRRNRAFTALAASRLVSFAGDSLSLVALMLHVAQTGGQAIAVAALLIVGDVVPGLLGPLAGALADRFDRRKLMVVCELLQGVALVALALALPPLPVLLALVGVRALAGQVFAPASRAALPALVADHDLPVANTAIGFGANGAEAVGPLLAAALLPVLGVSGVLLVDAASFAVSAVLLSRLPALPPSRAEGAPTSLVADTRIGLAYLRRATAVRIVVIGFCAVVAANGIDDVALVVLAVDDLRTGPSAVALLLGAVGIGLLVGYLLLTRGAARVPAAVLLVVGFAVSSAGNLLTGVAWAVSAVFALQAVRGLGLAAMDVAHVTLLQRLVPDHLLGRVFGNLYGAIGLAAGVSYLGGGLLLDAVGAPTTFLLAGAAGLVVTAVVAVALPRALRRSTTVDRVPPTLRRATPADAPEVARVWRAAWLDGHLGHVPDALLAARGEDYFAEQAADRVAETTLATDPDGRVLGLTIVRGDELVQMAVDGAARRGGVGGALLGAAERDIATRAPRAWLAVVPGNVRARAFYERNGWSDDGPLSYDAPAAGGTVPVPVHRYVKDVRPT
jgi:MFS family permease